MTAKIGFVLSIVWFVIFFTLTIVLRDMIVGVPILCGILASGSFIMMLVSGFGWYEDYEEEEKHVNS
jgi:hypothetical protein